MQIYAPRLFVQFSKSVMDKDTILIFDELIVNKLEHDEFKTLNEFCSINHYSYEVIAVSLLQNK